MGHAGPRRSKCVNPRPSPYCACYCCIRAIAALFKKDAERRKAQREAEALEKQREEKLSQLVEKFGKVR